MKVLAISYGRNLFDSENIERKRMEACAKYTDSLHMIIFTKKNEPYQTIQTKHGLYIHPTCSKNKVCMMWDAYKIATRILLDSGDWVISSQDPFETGVIGYFLSKKTKYPWNVQEHGDVFSTPHWKQESFLNRIRFFIGKIILRKADSVRVVSKRMIQTMQTLGVKKQKILQLAVRTDINDFYPTSSTKITESQPANKKVTILTMARLVKQKNILFLLDVVAELKNEQLNFELKIVGSGPQQNEILEFIGKNNLHDVVKVTPWTDNPAHELQNADIYVLSSNYEGWGRVIVEAMQAGLPVVTTDVGCANELLLHGEHGLVSAIGDKKMYVEHLRKLIAHKDMRHAMGTAGQKTIKEQAITLDEYAADWLQILKDTK